MNIEHEEEQLNSFDEIESRLENGIVASYVIEDDDNSPILRKDDIVQLIQANHYEIKDFVFYKFNNEFFLKRVIRLESIKQRIEITDERGEPTFYTLEQIKYFLASDKEKILHVVYDDQILGRAISRQRKLKFFSLTVKKHHKIFVFFKTKFVHLRFKNRIADYDRQINYESLRKAYLLSKKDEKKPYKRKASIINEELLGFESPNDYLKKYEENKKNNISDSI